MSANYVGFDHINAMLTWVSLRRPRIEGNVLDDNDLTALGRVLLEENVKSLQALYPTDWQELVGGENPEDYSFATDTQLFNGGHGQNAVRMIKLCQSLDYQSCEHDEWEASRARKIVHGLITSATYELNGYDAAPWQYDRAGWPEQEKRVREQMARAAR